MCRLHRRRLLAAISLVVGALLGCSDTGGGTPQIQEPEDATIRLQDLLSVEDVATEPPDVPVLQDCVGGDTRPCGSDDGECVSGLEHCLQGLWDGVCAGEVGPHDELCNTLDDNCDGNVDEGFPLGSPCKFKDERGIQRDGEWVCDPATGGLVCQPGQDCSTDADADGFNVCEDCDDTQASVHAGAPELCDNLDNNCDGRIDERFPLGDICYNGEGLCRRGGHTICNLDGTQGCDAVPDPPAGPEICGNEIDDNCDGVVDEGFPVGEACTSGVGECIRSGVLRCDASGLGTECDAIPGSPGEELCSNHLDDDCDGQVDEDFQVGAGCSVGVGACARMGVEVCNVLTGQTICSTDPGIPQPELCGNLVDDDCDGEVDEGFDVGDICTSGIGECARTGNKICRPDGSQTMCNVEAGSPHEELCGTHVDEDCDGLVDEGFDVGTLCTSGEGACARIGVYDCAPDRRSILCTAEPGQPDAEICNGVDDDCDGEVDEGYAVGGPCTVGIGTCQRDGVIGCDVQGGLYCRAAEAPPGVERCGNHLDDDCDGQTDEGFDVGAICTSGVGACVTTGRMICDFDGLHTRCDAVPADPVAELCGNTIDDDCDGTVDEGFDVGSACSVGVGACRRSGTKICSPDGSTTVCNVLPGVPANELCGTNIDEDCDGQVDEGFDVGAACSAGVGECFRRGQKVCSQDATTTVCGAVAGPAAPERCDGLDNNCNGSTDEGFNLGGACTSGAGQCANRGALICRPDGSGTQCDALPLPPTAELCDHLDNDCDGQTDEDFPGLGGPCDSPADADLCALGTFVCDVATGGMTCVNDIPSPEICDYQDNDCDGVDDNGFDLLTDENNCGACGTICPAPFGHCRDAFCYRQYWVDDDLGSNANGDGSRAHPWRTITYALSMVRGPRVEVEVLPGTYSATMHPTEFERFPLNMRDGVEIEGAGVNNTQVIVDAAHAPVVGGVFVFTNLVDPNNRLANLTIDHAGAANILDVGGAVRSTASNYTIRDLKIQNGETTYLGAAVDVNGGTVLMDHCTVTGNTCIASGLIVTATSNATLTITRGTFYSNTATRQASPEDGGVVSCNGGTVNITNSLVYFNTGNGLYVTGSAGSMMTAEYNTVEDNTLSGLAIGNGRSPSLTGNIFALNGHYGVLENMGVNPTNPIVLNSNLFWHNTLGNYVNNGLGAGGAIVNTAAAINTAVPVGGARTVVGDPLFLNFQVNPRLSGVGSAAYNAGNPASFPAVDIDNHARPRGGSPDIGAVEF